MGRETYPHLGLGRLLVEQIAQCLVKIIPTRGFGHPGKEPCGIVEILSVGECVGVAPQVISGLCTELAVNLSPQGARFAQFAGTKLQPDQGGKSVLGRSTAGPAATDGLAERI